MNEYLAIAIGALIPMIIGALWYNKNLFGNAWMNSIGMAEADLEKGNMGMIYGIGVLISAFIAYRMNGDASHTEEGMSQILHGMYHGAYSAGSYAIPVLLLNALFERKSLTNMLINAGYWIVALGLMGAFLYSVAPQAAG